MCGSADVLVIQQDLIGPVLSTLHHWKARDKTIVVDIHLAPEDMVPASPPYQRWLESAASSGLLKNGPPDPDLRTQFEWGLKLIHGATVPTARLNKAWNGVNGVKHMPSYINTEDYLNVSKEPHRETTIGWIAPAVCPENLQDLPAVQALTAVCRHNPQIKLCLVNVNQDHFDHLAVPEEQKELAPPPPRAQWANMLARFDLAILPLLQPQFDHHRRIRFLEYMLMDIPWIASRPSSHQPLCTYGWEIPDREDAWENALTELSQQLEANLVKRRKSAYLAGLSQHIDDHLDAILEYYRGVNPNNQPGETTHPFLIP